MHIATIDTGTTNTRVRLWDSMVPVSEGLAPVGVKDTAISGSTALLIRGVRQALLDALAAANWREEDVDLVLAAGMITSNMGLWELPHVAAPAGITNLAAGMKSAMLTEITRHPIWFIPGVKTSSVLVTLENCDQVDMMRGEEVETYGLLKQTGLSGPAIIVLPGSHTKFVQLDEKSRITGSITTIAGELLASITHNTLLANALEKSFAQNIEPETLLAGAKYARQLGLGRACFQVRLLDLFADLTTNQKANFLLGAVLASDLEALANSAAIPQSAAMPLLIGGGSITAQGFELLLQAEGRVVSRTDDSLMRLASGLGSIAVAAERGLILY